MSFDLILPFFRPIEHLLLSDTVSEIMVNPDSSVWIEEDGQKIHLHRIRFEQGALDAGLEVIANRFGKKLDADSPIMNLRLPDGSRLAAIIPPVVNPRPLLTIRKFTSRKLKMEDLIAQRVHHARTRDETPGGRPSWRQYPGIRWNRHWQDHARKHPRQFHPRRRSHSDH